MPQFVAPRAVAVKPPAQSSGTSDFNFSPTATSPSRGATGRYRGRRKKSTPILWIIGGCVAGVILMCGLIGALVDNGNSNRQVNVVRESESTAPTMSDAEIEAVANRRMNDVGLGSREVIGGWSDVWANTTRQVTIYKSNGRFYIERAFGDGSTHKDEIVEDESTFGRRFNSTDARFGEYFVIDARGDLQFWDKDGFISTANSAGKSTVADSRTYKGRLTLDAFLKLKIGDPESDVVARLGQNFTVEHESEVERTMEEARKLGLPLKRIEANKVLAWREQGRIVTVILKTEDKLTKPFLVTNKQQKGLE